MSDRLDLDPRPSRSPRLYSEVEDVPGVPTSAITLRVKPTEAQQLRLGRDLAIYLSIEGGMSFRTAARVYKLTPPGILKAYRRMKCRKSRV